MSRTVEDLATPSLLVDGPVLMRNVSEMAGHAARLGIALRPHAKTHKTVEVAALQRSHGASGLTVGTVCEAETFVAAGHEDVIVVQPPVGRDRVQRLAALASQALLTVVVDCEDALVGLARTGAEVGYLVEIDCGLGRCGVPLGPETAQKIARLVERNHTLQFAGLLAFAGHAYKARTLADVASAADDEQMAVSVVAGQLEALGVEVAIRSVGTTPTSHAMLDARHATEIRPGNYVFHDATQVALGVTSVEDCALSVLGTVISHPTRDRWILDCGSKAVGAERMTDRTLGFGSVVGHPAAAVSGLFEEHAVVTCEAPLEAPIGTKLRIVPNHACVTVNLHDRIYVVEGDQVVDEWSVRARGWRHIR